MNINTFDDYCRLEEREHRASRSDNFAIPRGEDNEFDEVDWLNDSESREFEDIDTLMRDSDELEEMY